MVLPITRQEIVIAKYISSTVFIMGGLSVTIIVIILKNILLDGDIVMPGYAVFFSNSSNFDLLCSNMILLITLEDIKLLLS